MTFANTSAALPGVTPTASSTGWVSTASSVLPGVQSTQETPNTGLCQSGERPGIGVQSGELGSASPLSDFLPGLTSTETLHAMNR
jgi:hypothetical protein